MPILGPINACSAMGLTSSFGLKGGFDPDKDIILTLQASELKTSYDSFYKVLHGLKCGAKIHCGSWSMIGGYSGPPEGTVLTTIAYALLSPIIHQAYSVSTNIMDMRYGGNPGRHAIWSNSVAVQALSRNTNLILQNITNQVSGPCTEHILYETAAGMINIAVSGASFSIGTRSAGGRYPNHITPLEIKFAGETLKASTGLTREEANEIVKELLPKYENYLRTPFIGKSYRECYDKEGQPISQWMDIYQKIKEELDNYLKFGKF